MRLAIFLAAAALLVIITVTMTALSPGTDARVADGSRATLVSHTVLSRACAGADLHIVRYAPDSASDSPLVATYCD